MTLDGRGRIIIDSTIDEFGDTVFVGNFNEYGFYAEASQIYTVILTETMNILAPLGAKEIERHLNESVNIGVNVLRTINKTFSEPIAIAINTYKELTRTYAISVLLTIHTQLELMRTMLESFTITQSMYFGMVVHLYETIILSQSFGNITATINKFENININDISTKTVQRVISESIIISDNIYKILKYIYTESVNLGVDITRSVERTFYTTVTIVAAFNRTTRFVMRKLASRVTGRYKGSIIKLEDGRDVK